MDKFQIGESENIETAAERAKAVVVSIIDEFTFGDLRSFRAQFSRLSGKADFDALKQRLRPICQRTLRRQVLAYVSYTNRHAMVQEFYPTAAEQQLY